MGVTKWVVVWATLILLLGMPAFAQDNSSQGQYGVNDDDGARVDDDLDCADFATQAEAQAEFAANPNDPNGLDADDDERACEDFDYSQAAGGDDNNPTDSARAADDLQSLSCAELLVLFRGGSQGQYGSAIDLDDSEVRAQVEVCLENEIVKGTAADGDLPDTGGLSLIGLAVLGVASAAAGLSVIRGGRR